MLEQMQLLEQWGKLTSEENMRDGGRFNCLREGKAPYRPLATSQDAFGGY
jgi:hypothetical protein